MLSVYWFCFAIGGAFVFLSVVSGFDGVDFGDHDAEIQWDGDIEWTDTGDRSQPSASLSSLSRRDPWYSFLGILKSLKFWTFGICFFGLTGLVLSNLSLTLAPVVVAIVSVVMGIGCGTLVTGSLRLLQRQRSDSLVRSNDLVGLTGTVELPFDNNSRGKVRLRVKGSLIDSIAYTDETEAFKLGDRVLVVSTEQNRLWVVSADRLPGEE